MGFNSAFKGLNRINVNAEIIDVGSRKPSVIYSQASPFLCITRKEMHYGNKSGFACI